MLSRARKAWPDGAQIAFQIGLQDIRNGKLRTPATSADDDIFLGTRLALNDEQDTTVLAGAIVDRRSQAALLFVEAERRLGDSWRIELEGRVFLNVPADDPHSGWQDDDFVTLRLTRFF